ncbi:MAG: hypothetical protein DRR42_23960 [Gammaproteobacteria bacterium]|nr:MAG: hypothetical protein DRR42_23960 [Gammaproteobacteria bacterium]
MPFPLNETMLSLIGRPRNGIIFKAKSNSGIQTKATLPLPDGANSAICDIFLHRASLLIKYLFKLISLFMILFEHA